MYNDIIPITYGCGSGGMFLSHLLIRAKLNNKELIELSSTGNAHNASLKDVSDTAGLKWIENTDENIINLLQYQMKESAIAPYFVAVHLFDINLINVSFKKSIRIVYDLDDAEDITNIFFNKFHSTNESSHIKNIVGATSFEYELSCAKTRSDIFRYEENMPNILFVFWKEYFRGDIEAFITKLSNFTGIDAANFSRESLTIWRTATEKCLD